MTVFKIAWRSIQHRGFGSFLTILSMSLGVMLVVSVLSIHGLISDSFRNNSSFGYNILVGARGGGLQLTMNTVYYLSQPVENIPYEYYLAFCDEETRQREMQNSISFNAFDHELDCLELLHQSAPGGLAAPVTLSNLINEKVQIQRQIEQTGIDQRGLYKLYTEMAIPMCLGDTWQKDDSQDEFFRCVGTTPDFFSKLVLDMDSQEKFKFAEGRSFVDYSPENGYYECVVGALVAKRSGLKLGDKIYPTHGEPSDINAHVHAQGFTIVGILEGTRTPHDRALFLNINGFYLMDGHVKPVDEEPILTGEGEDGWDAEENWGDDEEIPDQPFGEPNTDAPESNPLDNEIASDEEEVAAPSNSEAGSEANPEAKRTPLPIEQREVTSILILTDQDDPALAFFLAPQINQGDLESTLNWSNFRPVRAQKAAQAVNPVEQVTSFFYMIIDPIRWLLLALTVMICIVSAISILVGIYNSMNQRRHEIAVMRALGANRGQVMTIMVIEAFLLAFAGGLLGWITGHGLNAAIGPIVEAQTGVGIGFFDFAPAVPIFGFFNQAGSFLPSSLIELKVTPELLLIPGLIVLAMVVGIYPAISAYRTDVAKSLGK